MKSRIGDWLLCVCVFALGLLSAMVTPARAWPGESTTLAVNAVSQDEKTYVIISQGTGITTCHEPACVGTVLTVNGNGVPEWRVPVCNADKCRATDLAAQAWLEARMDSLTLDVRTFRIELHLLMAATFLALSMGFRLRRRVAHVEALLRRFNIQEGKGE